MLFIFRLISLVALLAVTASRRQIPARFVSLATASERFDNG
jgi:hypothetical protein